MQSAAFFQLLRKQLSKAWSAQTLIKNNISAMINFINLAIREHLLSQLQKLLLNLSVVIDGNFSKITGKMGVEKLFNWRQRNMKKLEKIGEENRIMKLGLIKGRERIVRGSRKEMSIFVQLKIEIKKIGKKNMEKRNKINL